MTLEKRAQEALAVVSRWITEKVQPEAEAHDALKLREWEHELGLIKKQIDSPNRIQIAMVGSTGAGKSTLLNAVLGEQVLPSGVSGPCTAFVSSIRHWDRPNYQVRVEYSSREDWQRDIETFAAYLNPGDADAYPGDTESRRLVDAARKRIAAIFGDAMRPDISGPELLALSLPDPVEKIFAGGLSDNITFDTADQTRKYLRSFLKGTGSLWPLVKKVEITGPFYVLEGGLELVDLPGFNDLNAARVEVTREFLKTSPFVWIVFNMKRGLTLDIQPELEKLLRSLVFAGTYRALTLVGSHADVVDNDVAVDLGFDDEEDIDRIELVTKYRRHTENQARSQLAQMVHDLARDSDDQETVSRMLSLVEQINVHTTSANAYMQLVGMANMNVHYGFKREEQTGVPEVRDHLRSIAKDIGEDYHATLAIRRLEQLSEEIAFFFRAAAQAGAPESEQIRERVLSEKAAFENALAQATEQAQFKLGVYRENFQGRIIPMLKNSVLGVRRACQGWNGIHWATLRAIVQRDGVFKSPSNGKLYDFHDDLTEPLMSQLPVSWEHYFTEDLGRVTELYVSQVTEKGQTFCEKVALILDLTYKHRDTMLQQQLEWFRQKLKLLAEESQSRILAEVTKRRSELAIKIPWVAKNKMLPGYALAKQESGSGMKARILQRLENTAVPAAPDIYATIQSDLLEGLQNLDVAIKGLFSQLEYAAKAQATTVAQNASIDIDEVSIHPAIRDILNTRPIQLFREQNIGKNDNHRVNTLAPA